MSACLATVREAGGHRVYITARRMTKQKQTKIFVNINIECCIGLLLVVVLLVCQELVLSSMFCRRSVVVPVTRWKLACPR